MCDPTVLAVAGVAATVIGAGVSYMGAQQAAHAKAAQDVYSQEQAAITARQQQQQAEYAAAADANNKTLADKAALDAKAAGDQQEVAAAAQASALIGRQRAVFAQNGVMVDSGSALDITSDTAATGQLDLLNIRHNADMNAFGFSTQAVNFGNAFNVDTGNASYYKAGGQSAQALATSGAFNPSPLTGSGTVLTALGSVADRWYTSTYGANKATATPA